MALIYIQVEKSKKIVGCSQFGVEEVWVKNFPKLLTESAIRLVDINQDGVQDVVFGFATGRNIQFLCSLNISSNRQIKKILLSFSLNMGPSRDIIIWVSDVCCLDLVLDW